MVAAPPGEVSPPGSSTPLLFTSRTDLVWEDASGRGARAYNLYRGALRWLDDAVPAGRIASRLPGNRGRDAERPGPGTGWYYLVTAVNGGGEGTPGRGSSGAPRPIAP